MQWEKMVADHPEILEGSTNKYQNWETTDPERWVPHGYVVDPGGFARRRLVAGFMEPDCRRARSTTSTSASSGRARKPGATARSACSASPTTPATSGAWRPCTRRISPPSFRGRGRTTAIATSLYHGGILCEFQKRWAKHQVVHVQYGRGERAKKNPNTGESVAGPVTLSDEELAKNRVDVYEELKKHPL